MHIRFHPRATNREPSGERRPKAGSRSRRGPCRKADRLEFRRAALRGDVGIVAERDRETTGGWVPRQLTTLRAGRLPCQTFTMDGHLVRRGPARGQPASLARLPGFIARPGRDMGRSRRRRRDGNAAWRRSRPATDIAFACGFNSLSGFDRAFQETLGTAFGDLRTANLPTSSRVSWARNVGNANGRL
jgi:AraC-like DNA-binding protein